MTYRLTFNEHALSEWHSLPETVRARLKKKLAERLENPHVPKSRLRGGHNRYKIKFMHPAIRLVYEVHDNIVTVHVLAIGERAGSRVYKLADRRT